MGLPLEAVIYNFPVSSYLTDISAWMSKVYFLGLLSRPSCNKSTLIGI